VGNEKAMKRMRNEYDFIADVGGMLRFITALRQTDHYIEMIYLNGACYQLHLLLKKYVDCDPLINTEKNHVVTQFKGKLFDITGEVKGEYLPMTEKDIEIASGWSFNKTKMIQIGECQVCEEPILA
jgi:hypothetical protein